MKRKAEIQERIALLKKQAQKQREHAVKMKGDEHEITREKAIIALDSMIAELEWVLSA